MAGDDYDPRFRGKIEKPQDRKDPVRLRGCGDPNCTRCNPETAVVQLSGAGRSFVFSGTTDLPEGGSAADLLKEAVDRAIGQSFRLELRKEGADKSVKEPPKSYQEARKKVAKYIAAAPRQAFEDIVGNEDALELLRDAIQAPVKHKALYDAYGMKMPKGALLSGPPGCGKTMFARAAAAEMKRLYGEANEFISLSGSELQSMFVGETEVRIKAIFDFAREHHRFHGHPLLVFMDEADVLLPDRTGRVRRVASWEESQVATFLAEMDGMQESGAFVLLATNRPEVIDQAVLRDGRCDFKITVKRPTFDDVYTILRKNFDAVLIGDDPREALVMTALEALFDPHKVLMEAHAIGVDLKQLKVANLHNKHFLFEHIISGAMAASVPVRATRHAFARDKATGVPKGVLVTDVIRAVNDLFEENRKLEHSFALDEFKQGFMAELAAKSPSSSPPPPLLRVAV